MCANVDLDNFGRGHGIHHVQSCDSNANISINESHTNKLFASSYIFPDMNILNV